MDHGEDPIGHYPRLVEFEKTFRNPHDQLPVMRRFQLALNKRITKCNVKNTLLGYFPIVETIKTYKLKEDLPSDLISGITSGVMMIPQGMAFAALSTLPTIVGLYISFFSSITYFLFGTGRQLSWGCIAILSLMIATVLEKYDMSVNGGNKPNCNYVTDSVLNETSSYIGNLSNSSIVTESNTTYTSDEYETNIKRIEVASGVSIIAGILLILTSRLGLSRVTSLMSNSLITGFTVGISFHVATSQFKSILGVSIKRYSGIGSIVRTWIAVLEEIGHTNIATLVTSIISLLVLYLVKKFINERYKERLRIPVPIELLVVIIATLISQFAFFHENFKVDVVKKIPVGIPAPKIPDLSLVTDYIGDGIVIIVIAYAQTLAMAKTMGLKHNYVVDSNQEMLACGACSLVCGIFSGYICASSVSRTVVQDGAGGKTQIASLFAACLVLLVIMLIGPYFYHLPMCVLSVIILVNLRSMFLKLLTIPEEWRKSRYDCAVWVFACLATIVLNADLGLLAGVLFSIFLIILRTMLTPVIEAGQIQTSPLTVELRSINNYSAAKILRDVKIIKIKTPLYFVNADIFTSKVFSKLKVNPIKLKKRMKEFKIEKGETHEMNDVSNGNLLKDSDRKPDVKVLILDAAEVSFIDLMGVQALQFLINELTSVGVEVLITSASESIIPMLISTGFWKKHGDRLYLSVEAALASIVTVVSTEVENDLGAKSDVKGEVA
ncbi:unnamed protein product [Lymnaea stagnalis]|uniref:STAS domain-containing protein n=1 Tax=Lymnaea stagnalis TaxID=6523 RepID=A0AAV2HVN5_LYMST